MRLLFIRLSALGDIVHTLPAAALIKNNLPGTRLTWVVEPPGVELLVNNPVVDDIIVLPKSAWVSRLGKPLSWPQLSREVLDLRALLLKRKFDMSVDFQGLLKSSLIGYTSGAPVRVGFSGAREMSDRLLTHRLDVGDYFALDKHVVEHNLALGEFVLRLAGKTDVESSASVSFPLPPESTGVITRVDKLLHFLKEPDPDFQSNFEGRPPGSIARQHFSDEKQAPGMETEKDGDDFKVVNPSSTEKPAAGSSAVADQANDHNSGIIGCDFPDPHDFPSDEHGKVVILIPGTTWSSKIWPVDRWAYLAVELIDRHQFEIVLIGGPLELAANQNLYQSVVKQRAHARILDLTGKTTITDLIELFRRARLVVGADTGPLHLAAGLRLPEVVGVYGSTPWRRNGPYGENCSSVSLSLSCQPCFKKVCPLSTLACLNQLSVDQVLAAISNRLEGAP